MISRNCWTALSAVALLVAGCNGSGGKSGSGSPMTTTPPSTTAPTTSSTVLNGTSGAFNIGFGVAYHTATTLSNGSVFVAGGVDAAGQAIANTSIVEVNAVGPGPALKQARFGHTATILGNGTILIAGGQTTTQAGSASLE